MRTLLVCTALLLSWCAGPAMAAEVEVRVSTVGSAKGVVRAEICRAVEWLKGGCAVEGVARARPGMTVVTVHDVAPGTYAIVAWHDRNDNDKVDQTWLGIPEEGVGFSNDPALGLRGPRFGDSAVEVGAGGLVIEVHLKFE